VQAEWAAVAEKRPDGEDNHVAKKLRGEGSEAREKARVDGEKAKAAEAEGKTEKADKMEVDGDVAVKNEDESPKADDVPHTDDTQPDPSGDTVATSNGDDHSVTNGNGEAKPAVLEASMGVRRQIEEVDRGPLLPDHLREALRRYKKAQYGGTVGFTGLSLEGKDNAAARMGGRKLFK
jgi:transcription initiation factor TFIID subunit 11